MPTEGNGTTPSLEVAVIGSGLSAVGAVQALRRLGLKPTVLDKGEGLEADRAQEMGRLAAVPPGNWGPEERAWLNQNPTLSDGRAIPQKLVFGSRYFYGTSRPEAPVEASGNLPPFSYALGGLSCGWGATVLPPQDCDLSDWPVKAEELGRYCAAALEGLPYSAAEDGLSLNFPILSGKAKALRPSRADERFLQAFEKAGILKKDEVVFGRSRLLISPDPSGDWAACKYCGQCMSGCVYRAIYKAGDHILAMAKRGEIDYVPGCLVQKLEETGGRTQVHYLDEKGDKAVREFDRVFLAAGAVNTTRIVMHSLGARGQKVSLKRRGSFLLPAFSFRSLPSDWPDCNTEPGLFLEFRGKGLDHWVHVQLSAQNELLLQKLGARSGGSLGARLKRLLASHFFMLFVNYHSDHSGTYDLSVEAAADPKGTVRLRTVHHRAFPRFGVLWATATRLLSLFAKIGCLPLFPFGKLNSGSYHVGGTLPMRSEPKGPLESDTLGRVGPWKRIHVVDSAIFPSLPGTTIGLLLMANAYRIVEKALGAHGGEA